jgi:hypothetical protein
MRMRSTTALVAAVMVACLGLTAVARADVEPNDNIVEAEGPLSSQVYSGTLQTEQDTDWYWLSLGSQKQVTITASYASSECNTRMELAVINWWGKELATVVPTIPRNPITEEKIASDTATATVPLTTEPGIDAYYLKAFADTAYGSQIGCHYSFSVGPASAFQERYVPAPVVTIPSTARSQDRAMLMHGQVDYQGETTGQQSPVWLSFVSKANAEVQFELTDFCGSGHVQASLDNGVEWDYQHVEAVENGRADTESFSQEMTGFYYVSIVGPKGCGFQAEIEPAKALVTKNAQLFAPKCRAAKLSVSRRRQRVKALYRELHHASSRGGAGHIHHLVEVERARLRAAHHSEKEACS